MVKRSLSLMATGGLSAALAFGTAVGALLDTEMEDELQERLVELLPPTAEKTGLEQLEGAAAHYRENQFAEALEKLKQARAAQSLLPPAHLMLARMHLASNRREPARAELERAVVADPDYPGIYLQLGELAFLEGHRTDAYLNFNKGLALAEANPDRFGDNKLGPLRGSLLAGLTIVAEQRRDWPDVQLWVTKWLALDESNGRARQRLARALFSQGQTEQAYRELQRATADQPALEPAQTAIAAFYEASDRLEEADEWYRKSVVDHPERALSHIGYARWLLRRGQLVESEREAKAGLELDTTTSRSARLLIGLVQRSRVDLLAAESTFQELVAENANDFAANNQLALVLVEQDDPEKRQRGLAIAQTNAEAYPTSAEALTTLAWAHFRTGRLEDAERMLQVAAAARGGHLNPDMSYYIARTLEARGREEQIPQILRRALGSTGRFTYRRQAQEWLEEFSKGDKAG